VIAEGPTVEAARALAERAEAEVASLLGLESR
jgi:adenine/guanine phosphoribosyltransferase-like PRPP-binding protein